MTDTHLSPAERGREGLLALVVVASIVGALTGLVAVSCRLCLEWLAEERLGVFEWAREVPILRGALVIIVAAAMTSTASWLVHRVEPMAEGSGIPRTEAVVRGATPPGSPIILPIKFVGGLLSIGPGLALGREGPSVHMGGNIGITMARLTGRSAADLRILVAAGAGAGLATAFNAPIAGAVFVLEELLKRFDPRTTLATLASSAGGFLVSHLLISGHDFPMPPVPDPTLAQAPAYALVGLVAGLLGVVYNKGILLGLRWADTSLWPVELRAAIIGALVALFGLFFPTLVGGGDNLTHNFLLGGTALGPLLLILAARFALGIVSYSACVPGGLFAPQLTLGAGIGLAVALILDDVVPALSAPASGMALVGLAAFFSATVRTPITGIVLAVEMTGTVVMLPPMLGACAVALLVAELLRSEPIYELLARRSANAANANRRHRRDQVRDAVGRIMESYRKPGNAD